LRWLGKTSLLIWQDQPLFASYLTVPSDLILIMDKYVVFSAPCLKALILAHFRVSEND